MSKLIDAIFGDFRYKKVYRENEKRAKNLPKEYAVAYKEIRNYLWASSGILTVEPLISLVDLLEEAAANGKTVTEVTGTDVAAFADELVQGEKSFKESQRTKLNKKLNR